MFREQFQIHVCLVMEALMASCMGLLNVYGRLHSFLESSLLQCVHGVFNTCVLIDLKSGLLQHALLFCGNFLLSDL